ncbi:MAG: hypothetical protein U9R34_08475 [Nanoarchaeota archaeon]|nr:hypothetical protein [Nanoarchaeota archaeon]
MAFSKFNKNKQKNITEFSSDSFREMSYRLKKSFRQIKQEFSDHLTAINQNTNEMESAHEYLCELDSKIEKLAERIDEISMHLGIAKKAPNYNIRPLTRREQEVFLFLYTQDDGISLTYTQITRRLALTQPLVQTYISNMIAKGVPIVKKYVNNIEHLSLDLHFKALQAKENIVGIHKTISKDLLKKTD